MGISRLARTRWIAVPMMAATIGLASPVAANAATTAPPSTQAERPVATAAVTEVSLGSYVHDTRGSGPDRYKRL